MDRRKINKVAINRFPSKNFAFNVRLGILRCKRIEAFGADEYKLIYKINFFNPLFWLYILFGLVISPFIGIINYVQRVPKICKGTWGITISRKSLK